MIRRILPLLIAAFVVASVIFAALARSRSNDNGGLTGVVLADLGELHQGDTSVGRIVLRNADSRRIVVRRIITSCECTKYQLSRSELASGESATIVALVDVGARRGSFHSTITVIYEFAGSPQSYELLFTLSGNVDPDIRYEPHQLSFQPGFGNTKVICLRIGAKSKLRSLTVFEAYSTNEALKCRIAQGTDKWIVEVTCDRDQLLLPNASAEIIIRTNSPHEPLCRIPVDITTKVESVVN